MSTNFTRIRPEKDLNLKEKKNFWSKLEKEEEEKKREEIKKQKELKLNERNLISNKVANNALKLSKETNDEQVLKKIDKLNLSSEIVSKREQFWAEQEADERRQREEENRKRLLDRRAIENEIRHCEKNAKQIMNTFNNPSNTNSTVKKINAIDEINLEKKKVLSSIKNSLNNKENNEMNMQRNDLPEEDELQEDELNDEIVIHDEDENSLSETELNRTFTKEINTNQYYKLQTEYCSNNTENSNQFLINQQINEEDEIYDEEYENEYCLDNNDLTNYSSYLTKRLSNKQLEDIIEEDENLPEDELADYIQEKGLCAKCLFDYQAADETEISFDPNDIITHIEKIHENWWRGRDKNSKEGLFPSNFVQILN